MFLCVCVCVCRTLRWRDTEQQLAGAQAEIKKLNREVKRLEKEVENEKRMKGEAKEEHKRAVCLRLKDGHYNYTN